MMTELKVLELQTDHVVLSSQPLWLVDLLESGDWERNDQVDHKIYDFDSFDESDE